VPDRGRDGPLGGHRASGHVPAGEDARVTGHQVGADLDSAVDDLDAR
jgi:hypothetical protein